jgi:hypothetical protein
MKYTVERLILARWMRQYGNEKKITLLATLVDSPEFMKQFPELANSGAFNAPSIYPMLAINNFYHRVKNVDFKRKKLRPAMQSKYQPFQMCKDTPARQNYYYYFLCFLQVTFVA